jgi:hypothetical protein
MIQGSLFLAAADLYVFGLICTAVADGMEDASQ